MGNYAASALLVMWKIAGIASDQGREILRRLRSVRIAMFYQT